MTIKVVKISLKREPDVVLARQRVKEVCSLSGLSRQDQTRLITAVSEIARNALQYAGGGTVEICIAGEGSEQCVKVVICDRGPGIANVQAVLDGMHRSKTGLGLGITGSRRLVDFFSIESTPEAGTTVGLAKVLPNGVPRITPDMVAKWCQEIKQGAPYGFLDELQRQNEELMQSLEQVQDYKVQLEEQLRQVKELNKELEETNKGILALHKELDDRNLELVKKTELLEQRTEQVQEADRLKSEFLANMSHEIRTPMNAIIGVTDILLRTQLTSKQAEGVKIIYEAGLSLLNIINDILDLAKIESGKMTFDVQDMQLRDVVEGAAELVSTQSRDKNLTLLTCVDPEIPLSVRGDPTRIRQIIVNLLSNAIKFTDEGEIVLRAELLPKENNHVKVHVSVRDTGIGMSEEDRGRLFQPFVQIDGGADRRYGGTGLGLSISKRLVELMGGEIGVHSVKGQGSTFWFTVAFECPHKKTRTATVAPQVRGMHVLVVARSEEMLGVLGRYLQSWHIRGDCFNNGRQALLALHDAVAADDPYHVAVIGFDLSEVSGVDLGRTIKDDPVLGSTKLVLLTEPFKKGEMGTSAIFDVCLITPIKQSSLLDCLVSLALPDAWEVPLDAEGVKELSKRVLPLERERPSAERQILLVEDNLVNQEVTRLMLEELGLSADIVSGGQAAVDAVHQKCYSLILMDCQMPGVDGYKATRLIRKMEATTGSRVPIVAMTASAMRGDRDNCLAVGMDDYLAKPVRLEELQAMLERWLPKEIVAGGCPGLAGQVVSPSDKLTSNPGINAGVSFGQDEQLPTDKHLPIELPLLMRRFGEQKVARLLELFLAETPATLSDMKRAFADQNKNHLASASHYLKGACAMIQAREMQELSARMEEVVKQGDWEESKVVFDALESEFQCLQDFAATVLPENKSKLI